VPESGGFRDGLLRALVVFGVALFLITEGLGAFGALRRVPLLACWIVVLFAVLVWAGRKAASLRPEFPPSARDPIVLLCGLGIAAILALTGITAASSPPNSADAMAYHMPRVVYWAEQGSVRFFPTPYLNQIMLQPLTEYVMLHTYVLSGGDRLINLVQWFASLISILGVSLLAAKLGAGPRGQVITALFCATLPSGILASSGAKNDYFLAMWLVAAVYFAARFATSQAWKDSLALGGALGLALLTKATAYLFAPWLLAAVIVPCAGKFGKRLLAGLLAAAGCALLLNAPHYARNLDLSGSILGFDSAHGDGFFRWRNETFGWKQTASNVVRNLSEQLGGRSDGWNRSVYAAAVRAHAWLGAGLNDPETTWRWSTFEPPKNSNHEANANNRWHLLILTIAAALAVWRALRRREPAQALYALALLCSFLGFCAYLKWQPYLARLLLPLFVAGAPLAGAEIDTALRGVSSSPRLVLQAVLCLFLLSTARLPALENWVRPLRGRASVLRARHQDQYFSDMVQWGNGPTFTRTLRVLEGSACHTIGLDITNLPLEYPLMALIRERQPQTMFLHTGVQNTSLRFRQPVDGVPCAVVCLDCAGDPKRESLYGGFTRKTTVDKFVVFE
jgi:dolichyl-phosphate-mannose-protein mannosyltransferase